MEKPSLVVAASLLILSCSGGAPPPRAAVRSAADLAVSPIAAENSLPGDPGWQLDQVATGG